MAYDLISAKAFLKQKGVIDSSGKVWLTKEQLKIINKEHLGELQGQIHQSKTGITSSDWFTLARELGDTRGERISGMGKQGEQPASYSREVKTIREEGKKTGEILVPISSPPTKQKTQPYDYHKQREARLTASKTIDGDYMLYGDRPMKAGEVIISAREQGLSLADIDPSSVLKARVKESWFIPTPEGTSKRLVKTIEEKYPFDVTQIKPDTFGFEKSIIKQTSTAQSILSEKVTMPIYEKLPMKKILDFEVSFAKKQYDVLNLREESFKNPLKLFFGSQVVGTKIAREELKSIAEKPLLKAGEYYTQYKVSKLVGGLVKKTQDVFSVIKKSPTTHRILSKIPRVRKGDMQLEFFKKPVEDVILDLRKPTSLKMTIGKGAVITGVAGSIVGHGYVTAENKEKYLGGVITGTVLGMKGYTAGQKETFKIFTGKGFKSGSAYKYFAKNQFGSIETGAPFVKTNLPTTIKPQILPTGIKPQTPVNYRLDTGMPTTKREMTKKLYEAFPYRVYGHDIPKQRIDFDVIQQKPLRSFGFKDYHTDVSSRLTTDVLQIKPKTFEIVSKGLPQKPFKKKVQTKLGTITTYDFLKREVKTDLNFYKPSPPTKQKKIKLFEDTTRAYKEYESASTGQVLIYKQESIPQQKIKPDFRTDIFQPRRPTQIMKLKTQQQEIKTQKPILPFLRPKLISETKQSYGMGTAFKYSSLQRFGMNFGKLSKRTQAQTQKQTQAQIQTLKLGQTQAQTQKQTQAQIQKLVSVSTMKFKTPSPPLRTPFRTPFRTPLRTPPKTPAPPFIPDFKLPKKERLIKRYIPKIEKEKKKKIYSPSLFGISLHTRGIKLKGVVPLGVGIREVKI